MNTHILRLATASLFSFSSVTSFVVIALFVHRLYFPSSCVVGRWPSLFLLLCVLPTYLSMVLASSSHLLEAFSCSF